LIHRFVFSQDELIRQGINPPNGRQTAFFLDGKVHGFVSPSSESTVLNGKESKYKQFLEQELGSAEKGHHLAESSELPIEKMLFFIPRHFMLMRGCKFRKIPGRYFIFPCSVFLKQL
jgi:hypothetical protein